MILTLIAVFMAGCTFGIAACMLAVRPVQYHLPAINFLIAIGLLALAISRL